MTAFSPKATSRAPVVTFSTAAVSDPPSQDSGRISLSPSPNIAHTESQPSVAVLIHSTENEVSLKEVSTRPPPMTEGNSAKVTPQAPAAPITIGSSVITPNTVSEYVFATQTLIPGGAPIKVSGTAISLALDASALVVGTNTQTLVPPATLPSTETRPLSAGGSAIITSKTPLSLTPSTPSSLTGSSTQTQISPEVSSVIAIAGFTFTTKSTSQYLIGTQTLLAGAPAITVLGTPVSLALSASALVIGSSTHNLIPSQTASIITIAGVTITADSASRYLIGSQTLSPGSPLTVSGMQISLAPSASVLVIGSSTHNLIPSKTASIITIAGVTITADSASRYLIGSQTLSPGSAITLSGVPISLAPAASELVVGSSTQKLPTMTTTAANPDLGPVILSGLGGTGESSTRESPSVPVFTGGADQSGQPPSVFVIIGGLIAALAMVGC
ncbi:hypothetical protein MMC16_003900 [Acarospora aff. strigata]|nr:hypothetical protein [Acarospora aff. strigata]